MKGILSICLFLVLVAIIFGQKASGQGGTAGQDAEREKVYQDSIKRTRDEESRFFRTPPSLPSGNRMLSKDDRAKLQPSVEATAQYSQFLKQSRTGIFKIFPDFKCNPKVIDANDKKCLNSIQIFGNASVYSFFRNTHLVGSWTEIRYSDNLLSIYPAPGLLGIIEELGNVSLDNLDKNSSQFTEIKSFQPPTSADEIYRMKVSLHSKISLQTENTYTVRLMHFSNQNPYRFERNDRTDLLLVLRVIRRDEDESLTIIWKEIERKKTPKLKS